MSDVLQPFVRNSCISDKLCMPLTRGNNAHLASCSANSLNCGYLIYILSNLPCWCARRMMAKAATKDWELQMHSLHANTCWVLSLWWLCLRYLLNLFNPVIQWLAIRRNFYQCVQLYHDCAIIEAWLPFITLQNMYLQFHWLELWVRLKVFYSWYMQNVGPLQAHELT